MRPALALLLMLFAAPSLAADGPYDESADARLEVRGIPAIAILSPRQDVLYATRAGELANARKLGDAGIHEFFKRAAAFARPGN